MTFKFEYIVGIKTFLISNYELVFPVANDVLQCRASLDNFN